KGGTGGKVVFPSRLSRLSRPSRLRVQDPRQLCFGDAVLRDFPAVHQQHGNLEAEALLERGIGRNVDLVERQRHAARDMRDDRFHLLAQMTARARVDRQRDRSRAGRSYELIHSWSRARVSTVPTRSLMRAIPWRCMYARIPSSSFGQMNGSTKLAVPTWTADAPAMMNSIASRASAMPPIPMIGIFTLCRHS